MKKIFLNCLILSCLFFAGCTENKTSSEEISNDILYSESNASYITFSQNIEIQGNGLSLKDDVVTISSPGTYIVEGESEEAKIIVNSEAKGEVKIVLKDASLTSSKGPVIDVEEAEKTYVITEEGISSITTTGQDDNEESAAILSHDDLVVTGNGRLNINSENDGIKANDSLSIQLVTLNITAGDDGIEVNDYISFESAVLDIVTGEGASEVTSFTPEGGMNFNEDFPKENDEEMMSPQEDADLENNREMTPPDQDFSKEMPPINQDGERHKPEGNFDQNGPQNDPMDFNEEIEDDTTPKYKGIKCDGDILFKDSDITVNGEDDAIHSNGSITIEDGTFNLKSGDDGIHADQTLTINSGSIDISMSYEGLEARELIINDGNISVTSSDDGINTADSSFTGNNMESDESMLTINGGNIIVNAQGDGIDMNGNGEMNDGSLTVYGPTSGGDGAIDYAGIFNVNGGTLLAGGSSTMALLPSDTSKVNSLMIDASNDTQILDEEGNVVFTYSSEKSYENLVIASSKLETGKTYTIIQDGIEANTVTITSLQTNLSTKQNNQFQQRPK